MSSRHLTKLLATTCIAAAIPWLIVGCGGGGGSSTSSTAATGSVTASVTDGPGDDYDHVWVTIKSIAFHTDANQVWSAQDATWQRYTLPTPITVDLSNLTNGAMSQLLSGIQLPAGSYRQIRLFLAGYDDALTSSAQTQGLTWNDQVTYTDNSSVVHNVPLEIPNPANGIPVSGTFDLAAGGSLNLVFDFDLEHDLVRFHHGTEDAFTLKPELHYYDPAQSGAIVGRVDTSQFCTTSVGPGCMWNLIVKAERLSDDQSRHVDVRATHVRADGSFVLYPVVANATYDLLIRGRNAETIVVKSVPVTAGATPSSSAATDLSSSPIVPTLASSGEYYAQLTSPLSPSSGWAVFQQTLPGVGEVPYEVRWGNTNPFSGLLQNPMALVNGPIHVATYNGGSALSFNSATPLEGAGTYAVKTRALGYYDLSAAATLAPLVGTSQATPGTFTEAQPTLASGVVAGTVTGSI
ncbi:MAG TPA: DUF4382 domain-containing protein, partial [Aquabacterium sp.]|nr:DUF4382 domain-containing protein [Aquabacterium sp.]